MIIDREITKQSQKIPSQFRVKKEWRHILEKKVIICIPTRGIDIYWKLVTFILQQYQTWPELQLLFSRSTWQAGILPMFRYLENKDYDYAFFVDADVGPQWDTILQLLSHDKPMVSAPVYMFETNSLDLHFNVHRDEKFEHIHHQGEGLEKIHSTSFASLLMHKSVLEKFRESGEAYTEWSPIVPEYLKTCPSDIQFFSKCAHFGIDLFVDWDCTMSVHHKYVELSTNSLDMFALRKADEIRETFCHGTKC